MLQIKDIHTYYGDSYILQGIDMEVGPDRIVAILGRNGMGKTTLMRSVIGFNHPRRGEIRYRQTDISRMKPYLIAAQGISLVPQGRQIFPSLTVDENLRVADSGKGNGWGLEKVYDLFPALAGRKKQMGGSLSGGEQQMLAIGRSLMTGPSLLLLDEPTEGLSPLLVQLVGRTVRDLHRSGISILLVEQKLGFALKYSDHIHIINKGRIVSSLSPAELSRDQAVRTQYLGV
ncbi:MAG TPA: ABC transporter ATP-binding protein [Thermodesulfobacteriota bacterium]|nr:ABC transporter ATP-binding protein [Thermodesulfobacteriota bacterium]